MRNAILLFAAFFAACGGAQQTGGPTASTPQEPPPLSVRPSPVPRTGADAELEAAFAEIAKEANGRVGVAAVVFETGANASLNPDEKFPMQSVCKVPVSMAVMKQVDAGKYKPEQEVDITKDDFVPAGMRSPLRDNFPDGTKIPIWHLIEYAIAESDGSANDALIRLAGGPAEVQKYLTEIGITDMAVKNTHKEFANDQKMQADNFSTPAAALALLTHLQTGTSLNRERSKLILDFMNESRPGQNRLRGLLPENAYVAHKTGTSATVNGVTAATNDIGIIGLPNGNFLAIAVFVGDSKADEKTREAVIAKIAKAAWDKWGK
ncbi:MAG: class A beta-lactamase [Pyrinomonadaceae bacterium]